MVSNNDCGKRSQQKGCKFVTKQRSNHGQCFDNSLGKGKRVAKKEV
jgi:hypothetical protein